MPNDAKLGLVVGVGLVVAFAVVFFHKEPGPANGAAPHPAAAAPASPSEPPRTTPAPSGPTTAAVSPGAEARRQHTVKEGETLSNLAERYYGDADKSREIFRVNRSVLKTPDQLAPGMVLTLPDLPRPAEPVRNDDE